MTGFEEPDSGVGPLLLAVYATEPGFPRHSWAVVMFAEEIYNGDPCSHFALALAPLRHAKRGFSEQRLFRMMLDLAKAGVLEPVGSGSCAQWRVKDSQLAAVRRAWRSLTAKEKSRFREVGQRVTAASVALSNSRTVSGESMLVTRTESKERLLKTVCVRAVTV
ncbi:hypothetical protein ACQEUV_29860 [Micromonospora aurantiaca (nom. illeg.)]|uniref:hypothetical protein n=1 Tax=Micromonospora aurantiaca (nom. illeg.) TaxID=47850 RepID=UPI003DA5D922